MCKAARSAKARKSVCAEQNKEAIKRESVRDVTTPRAFHKLLGNFLATSRFSSNFFRSEQFFELSSNSEISEQLLVLQIGLSSIFHNVYINNF